MSDFTIKKKNAKVDPCYGLYDFVISMKDIKALMANKMLYTTVDGEYAITIELEQESEE